MHIAQYKLRELLRFSTLFAEETFAIKLNQTLCGPFIHFTIQYTVYSPLNAIA